MALQNEIKNEVENALRKFCERRVPEHVRDKVRLNFPIRGNSVILFEERPRWNKPTEWINSKVAQFRFDPLTNKWSLHCRDWNGRWHNYTLVQPEKDFNELLGEVDRDPTGIFWG